MHDHAGGVALPKFRQNAMMLEHSTMPETTFFILVDSRFVNVCYADAGMLGIGLCVLGNKTFYRHVEPSYARLYILIDIII